jgi:hypothetical protein
LLGYRSCYKYYANIFILYDIYYTLHCINVAFILYHCSFYMIYTIVCYCINVAFILYHCYLYIISAIYPYYIHIIMLCLVSMFCIHDRYVSLCMHITYGYRSTSYRLHSCCVESYGCYLFLQFMIYDTHPCLIMQYLTYVQSDLSFTAVLVCIHPGATGSCAIIYCA